MTTALQKANDFKLNPPAQFYDDVLEMTHDIFGEPITVREEDDPEFNESYLVVFVHAEGDASKLARLNHAWHERLVGIPNYAHGLFRLSIEPV